MKKLRRTLGNFLFLWKPLWKYGKGLVIIDLLFTLVYPVRIIAEVTIAQAIIEAAQSGRGVGHVIFTAVVYIVIIVGLWVAREARIRFYTDWKLVAISAAIEREIYAQAMKTDFRYIDSPDYFDNYKMATEEYANRVEQLYNHTIGTNGILGSIVGLVTMTGVISSTQPAVLLIVLAGIVISMVFRMRLGITANKIWKETTKDRRRMNYLTRLLYNKPANADLKSTNVGDMIIDSFDAGRDGRVSGIKKYRIRQFINGSMRIVGEEFAMYTTMVYTALGFAMGNITSIGVFTTLVAAAQNLSNTFRRMSDSITELTTMTLYAERIRGFFELETVIEPSMDGLNSPDGMFELELRGVSFGYPKSDFGLKNLNIKIAKGEKIAIVGENGAGKTTLSKLLLRLYDADSGEILINGSPIRDYNIHSLRRRIGVAMQDPQLYALTVAQNMQVYHAAEDFRLSEILATVGLDLDLHREVTREFDDGGVLLSGGEAQKLGLARLLTGDFGMLLLDEPSSALDPLAEYKLTRLLFDRANGITTIMIAHRLSTIRSADRIYLVSDGEISEQGTHDELMALNNRYFEMFTKQGKDYIS